jgi:transcriptional regulator with XRE-family HTH domain
MLGMQLNDLAKKVGISPSGLSQIEKSKAFPSIITLKMIAENLHSTVGELIGENESLTNNPIIRKDECKFIEKNESGTEIYLLSQHDLNKQMDTFLLRFEENSDTNGLFKYHAGQIFGYVLSGEVKCEIERESYILTTGDSFYFNAKQPHKVLNNSALPAELLWVSSTSGF